jgi:AraC family transcriptional regulator of arabinose operon
MYHRMAQEPQPNPLLPGYTFNAYLVAGLTPIMADGPLDFFIDRPGGMKGYILNLTIKGQGKVFDGEDTLYCNPGDLLLFPPKAAHYYGRSPDSDCWYHRWVYFRPRAYWADWLEWHSKTHEVGRLTLPNNNLLLEFDRLFANIEQTQRSGRRFAEELGMNLLERLLLRAMEEDPLSPQKIMDPRVIEACQFITGNLAGELRIDEVARHVCLSPSRLAHLFREQVGINILRWREDQRVIRAKLLLQTTQESIATIGRVVGL